MTRMQRKVAIALMACAAACRGKPSPTAPTVATVRAIGARIDGPASIPPGSSAQLHFVRVMSDGSTVEVTQGVSWRSDHPSVIDVSAGGGAAQAKSRGAAQLFAGFSGPPVAGSSATRQVLVLEDGTFPVYGHVTEDTLPLVGAQVTVTRGIGQGLATFTDAAGAYGLFGVAGDVDLTVTRDGYTPVTRSLSVTAVTPSLDFSIHQVAGPTNFSGQYRLTITRSPACGMLPDDVGVQSFAVNLSQFGGKATLQLSAGTLASDAVVTAHVTGSAIDLTLGKQGGGSDFYYYYYGNPSYDVLEILDGKRYLGIDGVAHLDGSASPIHGTLNGSFTLYAGGATYKSAVRDKTCAAPDHAVVLAR